MGNNLLNIKIMKLIAAYQALPAYPTVKDTLEVLDFGFKSQQAITDTLADGKVNLLDVPNILKPLMAAGAAVDGFANVKTELTTLTPEGKIIIHDFVGERFDIAAEQIESLVEETIDQVIGDISIALKWVNYRKNRV